MHLANPPLRKSRTHLVNDCYNTPHTSLLLFHFQPHSSEHSLKRMRECQITRHLVADRDLYLLDHFFTEGEAKTLRDYSRNKEYSKRIFAKEGSEKSGEKPARAMDNREKWQLFIDPPQPVQEIYHLLSTLCELLQSDISTLPWDLCEETICSPAVATNYLREVCQETMAKGKHRDYHPSEGVPFTIPCLYAPGDHPARFENGSTGKPFLLSLMLYVAEENFQPDFGMGTVFYSEQGQLLMRAECRPMRLILFEGDIIHSIESSRLPAAIETWRISYVFKLIVNPKRADLSLKQQLREVLPWNPSTGTTLLK